MLFRSTLLLAVGYGLSLLSNVLSYGYVRRNFNLSNSLYYILAMDAALVSLASCLLASVYSYQAAVEERGWLICTLQLIGFYLLPCSIPCMSFWISLIRYIVYWFIGS